MVRPKIIAGNWKMNGTAAQTEKLLKALIKGIIPKRGVTVVVCPPFTSLPLAAKILKHKKIKLGAQDLSDQENGAYTGDISATLLKSLNVKYVIVGHSERRQFHQENDQLVNAKAWRALQAGLTPIICIGETLEQRQKGNTEVTVNQQLDGAIGGFGNSELEKVVIAYEPVWAIGTGKTASPAMAQDVHRLLRNQLVDKAPDLGIIVPIIYGGSVMPENAAGLLSQPDIDGALVGGASLDAKRFISILQAV